MKIGIDPGLTGAIAFLADDLTCLDIKDMPTMQLGRLVKHLQINGAGLAGILSPYSHGTKPTVYLEQVNAMPGQGVTSMFNFGMGYGIVQGICGALQFPLILVRPNAWKKLAGLIGKPKDAARTLAQQLYPAVDLSLKKHVGRADALLIGRFSWMV
jgi:crossover junction endodeoxyribonuclease RuvC